MLEIMMLIFGVILMVRGRAALGKGRHVEGVPVRIAGLIMMVPLPLSFASGVILGLLFRVGRVPVNPQNLQNGLFAIELVLVIGCAIVAGMVLRRYSVFVAPPAEDEPILVTGTGMPGWHQCPQCGQPGIPSWRKLFGPGSCRVCSCYLMLDPKKSVLAMLPSLGGLLIPGVLLLIIGAAGLLDLESMTTAGNVVLGIGFAMSVLFGLIISMFLVIRWVPLRRR